MNKRVLTVLVILGTLALSTPTNSQAASVKDIILSDVDPGHANGTVVKYYDELTPEQQAQYSSNYDAGLGYVISPVATVSWIDNGVRYTQTTKILIVALDSGHVVVPMSLLCSHSGCSGGCSVTGCDPSTVGGKGSCSGATCTGTACGAQNPSCSKTSGLNSSSLAVFGTI